MQGKENYKTEIFNLESLYSLGMRSEADAFQSMSWTAAETSFRNLAKVLQEGEQTVYGLHTHYGFNVKDRVAVTDFSRHQIELLNYLKVGTGASLPATVVRRALHLQVLKGLQGQSGVHPETLRDLAALAGSADLPTVPCYGSLGASGDLIPMAHAVAPIFKRGSVRGPRDVIGLVNTNSMMASYSIELFWKTKELLQSYESLLPDLIFATGASAQAYDERLFTSRQIHPKTKALLSSVERNESRGGRARLDYGARPVQNRYSLRVVPMLMDTFHKQLDFAASLILEEALAVADNPIIFEDELGNVDVIHGGLFYTSSLATALDLLNDVSSKLAELIDRQILILMDSSLSGQLPENLFYQDQSHCKGIHQLASALMQRVRTLCTPTKSMSFSCESNNQDVVPCSMTAANQLNDLIEVVTQIHRCFSFTTQRATHIRMGSELPRELYIENWSEFESKKITNVPEQGANFSDPLQRGESYEFCTK